MDSSDPKAFRRAELPLLCAYVQALSLSRWNASVVNEGGDTKEAFSRWESATRTAVHEIEVGTRHEARQEDRGEDGGRT